MKHQRKLIIGAVCALATGLGSPPTLFQASAQEGPYVSKDEYQKLQREHEQLKQELQQIKTMLQNGVAKAPGTNAAAMPAGEDPETRNPGRSRSSRLGRSRAFTRR